MAITPETQKKLYAETDARFAAQSGITRKLDPRNEIDKAQIPAWTDIYNKVMREYQAGVLAWTHDDPFVQKHLETAAILTDKAADHFGEALRAAADGLAAGAQLAQAEAARAAAQVAAARAASAQPPTIDPSLAAAGAQLSAQIAASGAAASPHDAVAAAQAQAAPGQAIGVHTPGGPPLAFTMQGGGQYDADTEKMQRNAEARARHGRIGIAVAAGAVGIGLLASAGAFKAAPSKRGSSRRRPAAVVIQNGGRR